MSEFESVLVSSLNIKDIKELKVLTAGSKMHLKKIAKDVIFHGETYENAGEKHGTSKQAVYMYLKTLFFKKYGIAYGKINSDTKNT